MHAFYNQNYLQGTRPTKKERDILFNDCITETNVDPDIAKSYREYNFTNEDPIGQCFVKCICLKENLCDAEHLKIITTTIEESVPPMAQKMVCLTIFQMENIEEQ